MNFYEFNSLLRGIFTKEEVKVKPSADNFNAYLVNRYLSMYHPSLLLFINNTMNDYEMIQNIDDCETLYKMYRAVIPKAPYRFIEYIGRGKSQTQTENNISDEDIKQFAELLEISTREVRQYLKDFDSLRHK